ncbi:UPF0187-domain-containing protein [Coccomyxa subellipsoidea C-169]|uniref:UPF0187-domain-containing protein n=1 Tax=Coccomyxa subellipsoidea (strain C-169) TaxID=574566 RepID=I0YN93_COCSC|nr:UPF0187-domain-containing protein [Coccomyxa subellipsoidea C-169]EIE19862.1 UPF0187-domain-containing protein [Coccomyxa subellipsoidea C-169]|eukprot:XP_005644406.1 UPF0187-domain-containing protein [Coccomyxa subellipsoidea C-169]
MEQNDQAHARKLLQPLLDSRNASKAEGSNHSGSAPSPQKVPVTFRAAAFALNALQHPMPKGGEGVQRMVEARELAGGRSAKYWEFVLSVSGRALPILPLLIYTVYCAVVTAVIVLVVPNYQNLAELKALQFPIQTLGLALFLLLTFRTNSSYDRWWEGRKLWDGINSKCLDMQRMALGWVAPKDRDSASQLIRYTIAFTVAAKKYLRHEAGYEELRGIVSDAELHELSSSHNIPFHIILRLTEITSTASKVLPPALANGLDGVIRGLSQDLNSCMRIFTTPMPFAYIVHLRSFMVLWFLGLPFAFVVSLSWWNLIVCVVVGYELLGFEEIGVEIEAPFGYDYNDIPVDKARPMPDALPCHITGDLFRQLANSLHTLGATGAHPGPPVPPPQPRPSNAAAAAVTNTLATSTLAAAPPNPAS